MAAGGPWRTGVSRLELALDAIANQQYAGRAAPAKLLQFFPIEGVVGVQGAHEFRVGIARLRLAAEHQNHFALYVDAGEIVVAVFGSVDAVSGEHDCTASRSGVEALPRPRGIVIIIREGVGNHNSERVLDAGNLGSEGGVFEIRIGGVDVYVLEIRSAIAHRLEAEPHELRRDVVGSDAVFGAARIPALQIVGGEKGDIALKIVGLDQFGRLPGVLGEQHHGKQWEQRGVMAGLLEIEIHKVNGSRSGLENGRVERMRAWRGGRLGAAMGAVMTKIVQAIRYSVVGMLSLLL